MSYVSTRIGNLSVRKQRAHAIHSAVESLEPRQFLSAVSISSPSVTEGGQLVYTVSLDQASTKPVTVNYKPGGGTAKINRDYTAKAGKLTFAAGETSKTITIKTKDNNLFTPNKTLQVRLSKPSAGNRLAGNGVGTGTIVNTDAAPVLTINNARITEGNAGSKTLTFTVKMTGGTETPLKVPYSTQDVTATSTGGKSADYKSAKGTLTFTKGKSQTIKIKITGDKTAEANEAFLVKLTPAASSGVKVVNPAVADASYAVGSIANDDGGAVSAGTTLSAFPPDVSINPGSTAGVTITLNQISADPVTVHYATADGTASAGSAYTASSGDVTFAPGETSKIVPVPVSSSATGGNFLVNLSSPSGADIATGSSTVTITNTPLPSLSVSDVTLAEGNNGTTTATFTISLSSAAVQPVSVDYATVDGTATAGSDYLASSGTLNFAVGETSKTITVSVLGDTTAESDETFTLNLSSAVNAAVSKAFSTATITNDDSDTGGGAVTDPNDNTGLEFGTQTGHTFDTHTGQVVLTAFNYDITSQRQTAVNNLQLQFFLVSPGDNLDNLTPYKTVSLGTITPGQTLSGTVDLTGSPQATIGSGQTYQTRLVANGVVFDTATSVPF